MPDHLLLIRSGATEYDTLGRIRGSLEIPLSPAGIAEAEAAARLLAGDPPAALYVASGPCAAETGRIIARHTGLRPRRVADLRNLDLGLWQGMLVDDIRRKQPRLARQWEDNPWAVVPPDGESLDEACDRAQDALERMLKRHPSGRVAVVAPHPLDRLIRWLVAGDPLGDLWARDAKLPPVIELPIAAQWLPASRRQPILR